MLEGPQREATCLWMADLRLAAWFLWMTPLEAALSSARTASRAAASTSSGVPTAAVSRNLRTVVLSADFTDLLRSWAAWFCLLRLIWDLMFATKARLVRVEISVRGCPDSSRHEGKRYQRAAVTPKSV